MLRRRLCIPLATAPSEMYASSSSTHLLIRSLSSSLHGRFPILDLILHTNGTFSFGKCPSHSFFFSFLFVSRRGWAAHAHASGSKFYWASDIEDIGRATGDNFRGLCTHANPERQAKKQNKRNAFYSERTAFDRKVFEVVLHSIINHRRGLLLHRLHVKP